MDPTLAASNGQSSMQTALPAMQGGTVAVEYSVGLTMLDVTLDPCVLLLWAMSGSHHLL